MYMLFMLKNVGNSKYTKIHINIITHKFIHKIANDQMSYFI